MLPPDERELEEVYSKYEARNLAYSKPQEHPIAIITGGQPGSGKSRLAEAAKDELRDRGGYLHVDADILREKNPSYKFLMERDDKTAANYTHDVASAWSRRLTTTGIENKRNLVIDQTSRDPEAVSSLTARLRKAGYRIEVRAMATSSLVSVQRIRTRYEEKKAEVGFGRFTPRVNHDTTYVGIPNTLERIDREKSVDRLVIYNMDMKPVYDNHLVSGEWKHPPDSRGELEKERERALTPAERHEFERNYDEILRLMENRHASRQDIAEVQADRAAAEKQLEKQHLGKTYEGAIVAIEGNTVYQLTGAGIVAHSRNVLSGKNLNLDALQESGQSVTIKYGAHANIGLVKEGGAIQHQKQELGSNASKGKTLGKF
jgi:adenylate kinase family enzyme